MRLKQEKSVLEPTDEQKEIISAAGRGEENIYINAFAGTGKTTTMKLITKAYPQKRFLYLAFNRAIAQEAKAKFGKNTWVYTTHGFAYGILKNLRLLNNIRQIRVPNLVGKYGIDNFIEASRLLNSLTGFCHSSYATYQDYYNNVEQYIESHSLITDTSLIDPEYIDAVFFDFILNREGTHDIYLKAFQMALGNSPLLPKSMCQKVQNAVRIKGFDVVLVDEAQDINPVTVSIAMLLPVKQRVFVGDKHQRIYSFRKASSGHLVNAIQENINTYYLTQSFRFTPSIARKCTQVLNLYKGEKKEIKGIESPTTNNKIAYITRTNAGLITKIAEFYNDNESFSLTRDPDSIFALALNVLHLTKNGGVLDKQFSYLEKIGYTKTALSEYAEDVGDVELSTTIDIVSEFGKKLNKYYDYAKRQDNSSLSVLTTAHTAKGLEFKEVNVADDFKVINAIIRAIADKFTDLNAIEGDLLDKFIYGYKHGLFMPQDIDEVNLYYVAISRAQKKLYLNYYLPLNKKDAVRLLWDKIIELSSTEKELSGSVK